MQDLGKGITMETEEKRKIKILGNKISGEKLLTVALYIVTSL